VLREKAAALEKPPAFLVFPMFVPSLSWQNDRFLYINGSNIVFIYKWRAFLVSAPSERRMFCAVVG
jgi:hypothetical protein